MTAAAKTANLSGRGPPLAADWQAFGQGTDTQQVSRAPHVAGLFRVSKSGPQLTHYHIRAGGATSVRAFPTRPPREQKTCYRAWSGNSWIARSPCKRHCPLLCKKSKGQEHPLKNSYFSSSSTKHYWQSLMPKQANVSCMSSSRRTRKIKRQACHSLAPGLRKLSAKMCLMDSSGLRAFGSRPP